MDYEALLARKQHLDNMIEHKKKHEMQKLYLDGQVRAKAASVELNLQTR